MPADPARRMSVARSLKRPLPLALAFLAVLVAVIGGLRITRSPANTPPAAFPAPGPAPAAAVHVDDFVGSDRCASCHATQHTTWSRSTHARAGQAPPGELVLRPFDGNPIRFRDATIEPRSNGANYEFVVRWAGRVDRYPVIGVVGAAHMVGGGTQGFVWRHPDGSVRLLPFEIAGDDRAWFCSTGNRGQRGWARITADMSITDCNDWPPVRVLGSSARFVSCQECHGSQIELSARPQQPFETRFVSLSINCESCHGPGRRHSENAQAGRADIGLRPLATLSRDESVAVCMRCHAVKVAVRPGYLPGADLDEHYSVKFPLLSGAETHVDGRTRTFAYQQGHYYSDCYLSGSMTCVDCHEPHGQQYRDITGRALDGRYDNAQCTDCHPSKAQQLEQHTRHAAQSPGSRCVSCHMPFVQQAAVGNAIQYRRSDHTISIPRPEVDERLGIVNACRNCHDRWTGQQVASETRRLWGELKPLRPIIAQMLDATTREDYERIILAGDTMHRLAYFGALARHFAALEGIDAETLPRAVRARLRQLAESDDDDVAALALATLHIDAGNNARTRTALVERLRALGPRDLSVRQRWATALGHRADSYRQLMRSSEAMTLYARALEVLPDDPAFLLALARARLDARDFTGATEPLTRLTRIEPDNSLAWTHLGHARSGAGDAIGAFAAYRQATLANPYDALAHFNLGNALLTGGRRPEAAAAYRQAIELDVSLAPAHFNLARLLILEGQNQQALQPLRAGLLFDPENREARDVVAQIEAGLTRR